MPPPISLEGFTPTSEGTVVQRQGDGPWTLPENSTLPENRSPGSVGSGVPSAALSMLSHAREAHRAIHEVTFHLNAIIDAHTGDSALLKNIKKQMDSLKESGQSYVTGCGGQSIWVPKENLTAAQVNA